MGIGTIFNAGGGARRGRTGSSKEAHSRCHEDPDVHTFIRLTLSSRHAANQYCKGYSEELLTLFPATPETSSAKDSEETSAHATNNLKGF